MKSTVVLFFIILVLASCSSGNNEIPGQDSIDSTGADSPKVTDRKKFIPLPPNVGYTVRFKDLCAETKRVMNHEDVQKRGLLRPYNFTSEKGSEDSLVLAFEFIDQCHPEYTGDVYQRNDTLFLGFFQPQDSSRVGDCWCNYLMTYHIAKNTSDWKTISVVRGYASVCKEFIRFGDITGPRIVE